MDVDFRYKDFDCSIIFGVLRWKPGDAEKAILSACWPDEWSKKMLTDFALMEINERIEKRHRKSERKWMAKAFKEEFTRDEMLDIFSAAFERLKMMVKTEAQSIPNINVIPGREVEI